MKHLIIFILLFCCQYTFSQNVGIGTNTPHPSAKLEVSSNNSGFLPPRMTTTERDAIASPAVGLQIYNLTTHCLEIYDFGKWNSVYCVPIDSTNIVDSTLLTDIDGHTYPTVQICNQTWMAKNLDVARYRNGDIIPQVTDPTEWANLTTGAWCWYNNDSATYGSVYGRLYNWYAVNDPRGLAPTGWHVSSDEEWSTLTNCLDTNSDTSCINCAASEFVGGYLKEAGTYHWLSPNVGATNSSNFTSLPGGVRYQGGNFAFINYSSNYFTSSESSNNSIFFRNNVSVNSAIWRGLETTNKNSGLSVRCVKDTPITPLNDGLVAYYPFNGNANDESGNGNNGTVNGATLTTDRFGNIGKAYSFDGATNYIEIPDNSQLDIPNVSISVWIKPEDFGLSSQGNQGHILSKREFSGWGSSFQLAVESTTGVNGIWATFTIGNNAWVHFTPTNPPLLPGNWIHVVYTHDNNFAKLYVDGQLINLLTITGGLSSNNLPMWFGARPNSAGNSCFYHGTLDDIRIYNRALTQAEITYLATH